MNRIHTDLSIAAFPQPDSVVSVSICKDSHLRASENGCPDTYLEYFADGTQPEETCSLHSTVLTPETKQQSEQAVIYPELLEQLGVEGNDSNAKASEHAASESEAAAVSSPSYILPSNRNSAGYPRFDFPVSRVHIFSMSASSSV